jgi:hypothetical protein
VGIDATVASSRRLSGHATSACTDSMVVGTGILKLSILREEPSLLKRNGCSGHVGALWLDTPSVNGSQPELFPSLLSSQHCVGPMEHGRISPALTQAICVVGAPWPYQQAAEILHQLQGLGLVERRLAS